jgi:predicted DNA-binding transcriptional regulator AlpA
MPINKLLSYNDLVSLGVVNNRAQLSRLQRNIGFPEGFLLSANSRRWYEHEIEEWVSLRSGHSNTVGLPALGDA